MRRTAIWISLAFLFLILSLGLLVQRYWDGLLEPRLREEAGSHAEILVQAQATRLADALATGPDCEADLADEIDEILALADPQTRTPFFRRIELELDPELLGLPPGAAHQSWGVEGCPSCFRTEAPMFDIATDELVGLARFWVSARFFRALAGDVRDTLVAQGVAALVLMLFVWGSVLALVAQLRRQITERQRVQRDLSENRRRYQRLLDNLLNYLVYARVAGAGISFVSDSVRRVLGWSPEVFSEQFVNLLTEDPVNAQLVHRAADGVPADQAPFEVVVRNNLGAVRYLECAETVLTGTDGRVSVVEGIARDNTAERSIEQALRREKERAEAANEAKSQFLANVSHEIRTPMNAIMGLAALALKTDLSDKQRDYLTKIDLSAHALLSIINDILDISKMETGRMELESIDFSLDEVIESVITNVALKAEEKGLEIAFTVDRGVPERLRGDSLRLGQILLNLTSNAVKFTRQGEVHVRARLLQETAAELELEICVRDTGIGIATDKLPLLFDPFTQADGSNTRLYGGTGLGLAISKHLATMMRGTIRVDSVLGEGSTFCFRVWLGRGEGASPAAGHPSETIRGLNALVVDDSSLVRDSMVHALSALSFEAHAAADAQSALQVLERRQPGDRPIDLVLMDWKMPGIDGIEAARRVRGDAGIEVQPAILLMSAHGAELGGDVEDEAALDGFVAKPVTQSGLLDAVLLALGHHQGGDVAALHLSRQQARRRASATAPGSWSRRTTRSTSRWRWSCSPTWDWRCRSSATGSRHWRP